MKLVVVVLFLSFWFQIHEVTIAENDALLSPIDGSKSALRSLQAQTNDTTTTDSTIPTMSPSIIMDTPVNGTEIPSNTSQPSSPTVVASPTSAPSFVLTATQGPSLTDETEASEASSGLQATDIALIVVGLIGIGFLGFGVFGSFLSGSKNAVNENADETFPAPSSAPTAPGVEIAEA